MEDILGGYGMCAYWAVDQEKESLMWAVFYEKACSLVCNEFVTRDYTVLYLVSKLAQAGPHQNARQNLRHGQVI